MLCKRLPIPPDFLLLFTQSSPFEMMESQIQERLDRIWEEEQKRRTSPLFNGTVYALHDKASSWISVIPIAYKTFIGLTREPSLLYNFTLTTVGVSGITSKAGRVLLAERSKQLTQYPGFFELAPSGGLGEAPIIDGQIDFMGQIIKELQEETGIPREAVVSQKPLCLIWDQQAQVIDICIGLEVNQNFNENAVGEYSKFFWLSKEEIPEFIRRFSGRIVPTTLLLLTEEVLGGVASG